jgi:N-acetyl sugar amidotransferase
MDNKEDISAKYGLPTTVRFCARCVISNQRPSSSVEFRNEKNQPKFTIQLDEEGVCSACRVTETKLNTDWDSRREELEQLCERFRGKGKEYDCIVPGSGGKDSVFAALRLKKDFGMHPLTVTWAPHLYTDWGWRNHQRWIHAGLDNVLMTPNGRVHRLLTRLAVDRLLHPFQAFILGQKLMAPRMAQKFGIPLVFYGESEAEYGNPRAETSVPTRDSKYFAGKESDGEPYLLGGVPINEIVNKASLNERELLPYLPITEDQFSASNVEVHYLGYYLKWHPQTCYYYSVENSGFEASPERTPGTYSKYNSIDDKIDDLHYYTTFIKFGIGRATYDAAQEIRSGDINRDEGVALVKRYDGEWPERFMPELMSYLSLSEEEFPELGDLVEDRDMTIERFKILCDEFRSPHLWNRNTQTNDWELRHAVWH